MSEKSTGDITVDETMYQTGIVLEALGELKEKGLLCGGYDINIDQLTAVIKIGEGLGFQKPNAEQTKAILDEIQERLRVEERD